MWKLSPQQRLERWRQFRNDLSKLDLAEALDRCAQFWAPAPASAYYLDPDQPDTWPDPWVLVSDNYYCPVAKALAMLYTIHLTDHSSNVDLELRIYQSKADRSRHNLAWINQGKYVLNSEDPVLLNIHYTTSDFDIIKIYSSADLKLDRY